MRVRGVNLRLLLLWHVHRRARGGSVHLLRLLVRRVRPCISVSTRSSCGHRGDMERAFGVRLLLREPRRVVVLQHRRRLAELVHVEVDRLSRLEASPAAVPAAKEKRDD
ncbi:hypothetical protein C8R45DRAFT_951222 [Mycena sanguinolenta]|nr:hypothetical protein C8R45DRAFT_951222 [Mycena sanguinolenta]